MTSTPPSRPGLQSRILITGASSGIGEALALHYARAGTHLVLWGRNQTRLDRVAAQAAKHGATTETLALDLCDPEAALEALRKADNTTPVDILILAAGLGDIRPEGELTELPEQVKTISLVNFTTPVTLATEMARRMVTRGGGNIALIGSVAAFHDLPIATAYSGSKAGLARFSTALHAAMTPHNVHITLVSPGYVDTPMSQRLEGATFPGFFPQSCAHDRPCDRPGQGPSPVPMAICTCSTTGNAGAPSHRSSPAALCRSATECVKLGKAASR